MGVVLSVLLVGRIGRRLPDLSVVPGHDVRGAALRKLVWDYVRLLGAKLRIRHHNVGGVWAVHDGAERVYDQGQVDSSVDSMAEVRQFHALRIFGRTVHDSAVRRL